MLTKHFRSELFDDSVLVDVVTKSLRDQFNYIVSVSDIDKLNTVITDLWLISSYETIQHQNHVGHLK